MKKISLIPKFYPIVDSYEWIEQLVPLGVKIIQLRIKNKSLGEIYEQASLAKLICEKYNCMLFLNDYWEIALDLKLCGVHLGFEDQQLAHLNKIKESGLYLGLSTHCALELETALQISPSYIALGPIFETTLKKMNFGPQGIEKITQWREFIPAQIPLVAIGGITLERANDIYKAGANSIAVVSDVTTHHEPKKRVKNWLLH